MKHALAGIIGQRETAIISAVVDEITAKPSEQFGLTLMPVVAYPAELIYHEKVSGFGGLLAERDIGAPGETTSGSSSEMFEFSGGAYQETKKFTEKDLKALRRLGSIGERGATGVTSGALDFLGRAANELKVKLDNRLNKIAWDAMLTGKYTYRGMTKCDFSVPGANTQQTATDWSNPATSTPFKDLNTMINTNVQYIKYLIKQIVINPITAAQMLNSQEARALITNNASAIGDINKVAQILYPGLPEIKVVRDSYQDQTLSNGIVVNGVVQFFLPDYFVMLIPDFGGTLYGAFGEVQMTYNLNDPTATIEKPAMGVYTFVDEFGLSQRKAPYVEVTTGFNGGANLMRSNDVLIAKAKVGI